MKLLNTRTLQVHQAPLQPPRYVALSYTWGGTSNESTAPTPAQRQSACTEARRLGLEWVWIDSLCIDSSSTAEISESINSRFRVFQDSAVCLVFLGDVSLGPGETTSKAAGNLLLKSQWLRRIWTLTELIASKEVLFFDRDWRQFGTKRSLLCELSDATRIDLPVLENSRCLSEFSIARRMSWACACSYDREEDLAYALIGLFGVNMTILYGEGPMAFLRLQEEILKSTDDASLFCWQAGPHATQEYRGLFARSPAEFSHFASIPPIEPLRIHGDVQLTSAGVVIKDVSVSHGFGSDIVLPLYSEDGTARYGMYLRFWKGSYVKPYFGFTRLANDASQTVTRICIIRDVDISMSGKVAMDFREVELAQLSAGNCDGSFRERRRCNIPVHHFESHAGSLAIDRGYMPSTEEPHQHGTRSNLYAQHRGSLNSTENGEIAGNVCRASLSASFSNRAPSNRADLGGSIPVRNGDTSTIGDYQTSECDSPSLDDDVYISNTLPSSIPASDSGHEFTLAKHELIDHVRRLLHTQAKYFAKRPEFESPISRKRKRQKTENLQLCEEGQGCLDSDSEAAVVDEICTPTARRIFACPFYLYDRRRHRACLKSAADLRDIRDVKEHLLHAHRKPPYCPICHCVFRTALECEEHVHAGGPWCQCEPREPIPEGISEAQAVQLAKRPKVRHSDESAWFGIWEILFSGEDKPRQPFLDSCGELEAAICRLHAFWSEKGDTIITEFLRQKALRNYGLRDEERSLAALHNSTVQQLTDEVISGLTEDQDGMHGRRNHHLVLALTHLL